MWIDKVKCKNTISRENQHYPPVITRDSKEILFYSIKICFTFDGDRLTSFDNSFQSRVEFYLDASFQCSLETYSNDNNDVISWIAVGEGEGYVLIRKFI